MEVNGKTLHFSAAVIATGATAAVPPIKGLKVSNLFLLVFYCYFVSLEGRQIQCRAEKLPSRAHFTFFLRADNMPLRH